MTTENKQNAMAYVRSDIDTLGEQTEDTERRAYHHRALAGLFAIRAGGLVTDEELQMMGDQIGAANAKAARQVRARR